ncbi:glucose 1-dehydrogenase [Halobacteriales archaeon SW_7_68_16]|nr:MAG: glucose 1-dehydrogenase [Halobacteriales archaeon SW_7_68_16]
MSVQFDFDGEVAVVTGASGALGSAVAAAFHDDGATVVGLDVVRPEDDDSQVDPDHLDDFYETDMTDESQVAVAIAAIEDAHDRIDHLCTVAGTWRGGTPIDETDREQFQFLLDANLTSAFLAAKHALPKLRKTEGTIVSVSARSSLSGGEGDGPYRISKAGVRLLTETLAEENEGIVRANCVLPSVMDTPMNREMMEPSDDWVEPAAVARTMLVLCSEATAVTSGAAVPVYGEA